MKILIYPNLKKENVIECSRRAIEILKSIEFEIYIDINYHAQFSNIDGIVFGKISEIISDMDYALTIGGDGTILKCSRYIKDNHTKLIGINMGRLGFMASLEFDELNQLKKLKGNNFNISRRMMINVSLQNKTETALNDVVVYESKSKMAEFTVYSNENIIGKYRANGIIFSTPTGSTAYALSSGGPVIQPELKCIEMSLICPHSLFFRPIIFSCDSKLRVVCNSTDEHKILVSSDGEDFSELSKGQSVFIERSEKNIDIIDMSGNTFFDSLNKKLMHPIK
jgi:NAD+ kinase